MEIKQAGYPAHLSAWAEIYTHYTESVLTLHIWRYENSYERNSPQIRKLGMQRWNSTKTRLCKQVHPCWGWYSLATGKTVFFSSVECFTVVGSKLCTWGGVSSQRPKLRWAQHTQIGLNQHGGTSGEKKAARFFVPESHFGDVNWGRGLGLAQVFLDGTIWSSLGSSLCRSLRCWEEMVKWLSTVFLLN